MEETEVVNPTTVDTSKITNEVLLFPVNTEDAKLEQTLGETNPATTTETSDLATETPAGDETKSSTQEPINPS